MEFCLSLEEKSCFLAKKPLEFKKILEFRGKIIEFRVKILSLGRKKYEKNECFYLFFLKIAGFLSLAIEFA